LGEKSRLMSGNLRYFRQAWDLALDLCLRQLPRLLEDDGALFQHSPFFTEQLTAFDVWLKHGDESRAPPEQLPIVLQVAKWQSCCPLNVKVNFKS